MSIQPPNLQGLSVMLITKNEARDIEHCLKAISWAEEIIVLDSGSEDHTVEICKRYTDSVHINKDWQGYGIQKNRVLSYTTQPWVLSIDADEVVSDALAKEIQQVLTSDVSGASAYWIPRRSFFCGRLIRYGDWKTDGSVRLFKRGTARFTHDLVHEKLIASGQIGYLKQPLWHYTYKNFEEVLSKINAYSTASATLYHEKGLKSSFSKAIIRALWTFFRGYCLRLGCLDGRLGFMLALSNAEQVYYKYAKLVWLKENHAIHKKGGL